MSDDNEFARYLAQYIVDNYPWFIEDERLLLEKLIKEFMEKLP